MAQWVNFNLLMPVLVHSQWVPENRTPDSGRLSVNVAVKFTISAMFLPLPQEHDLFTLPNDSKELVQEQSFFMKGEIHKIGQAILCCSKTCHGYYISFSVMHSFRTKHVPIWNGEEDPLCFQGVQQKLPTWTHVLGFCSASVFQTRCFHWWDAFTDKYPHPALELSCAPPLWLLCNPQYSFPTGARAQQL